MQRVGKVLLDVNTGKINMSRVRRVQPMVKNKYLETTLR